MNLRQMEVFHAVMTCGTVTAAARALNVSQPSVTCMLRHTEDMLRLKLFERAKGRLIPTAEAQALFAQIEHVFERVHSVRRTVDALRDVRRGSISIVAIPAVGATLLPAAIGAFLKRGEGVDIRYHMRSWREAAEMVQSGAVDVGFGYLTADLPRLTHKELTRRDMICIMPRGHALERLARVTVADAAEYPLISYMNTHGLAPMINSIFAEARVNFRPAVEVGTIINAWAIVNSGAGVALVDPYSAIGNFFPNVVARPLEPSCPIALEVMQPAERPLTHAAQAFVRHFDHFVRASDPLGSQTAAGRPRQVKRARR